MTAEPGDTRLRLHANPLRLVVSGSLWLSLSYLTGYLVVSGVLFAVALAVSATTAVLSVTIALAPLLVAAAATVRWCADVERFLLRQVFRTPVRGSEPEPAEPGLWRRARRAWTSAATWRELAYLVGVWPLLYALDAVVVAVWASLAAGVTVPLWYSHVADVCVGDCGDQHTPGVLIGHFPNGAHGQGASGFYVHTAGPAVVLAACCAVAFLLWNYVPVLTARLHGQVARALLRRPGDPLGPARTVLAEPGPLGPLLRGHGT